MAPRTRTKRSKKSPLGERVRAIFLSTQGLPIVLSFVVLTILFVLFRMKGVELNYQISSISKDIQKVRIEGKELKAQKAKLLSVNKLRKMAKTYKLQQPKQHQIIVMPK